MSSPRQYCTFHVGDLLLALDVGVIQEVLRYQQMTRIPTAPSTIRGLVNLRGQIVVAYDLRRRLGLSPNTDGHEPFNIVIRGDDGVVSLLVDEIGDVLTIPESAIEPLPSTVTPGLRELMMGLVRLDTRLLMLLDPEPLLNNIEPAVRTDSHRGRWNELEHPRSPSLVSMIGTEIRADDDWFENEEVREVVRST